MFNIGDKVTCKEDIHTYTYTRVGIMCEVKEISGSYMDVVTHGGEQDRLVFNVLIDNFELYKNNTEELEGGDWL